MYDSIVIPVDLSSTNERVLEKAQALGDPDETEVVLLHVIETLQDEEPGEMDDFYEELRADAEEKMTDWTAEMSQEGFTVEAKIVYGNRGPEIINVAEDEDADLIILRSRQIRQEDEEPTIGTVSHQVAVFAPCSVYLVRVSET